MFERLYRTVLRQRWGGRKGLFKRGNLFFPCRNFIDLAVWGLSTNNLNILHLIFGPSLAVAQSQNPQRSAATSAVLFTRRNQIQPKSERNFAQVICGQALID
jgi:hypothetical protein